jgi:hypothetical protein
MMVIIDDHGRFVMCKPLKRKSDAPDWIIEMIKRYQVYTGKILERLHTDGGGEFLNKVLKKFLADNGTELTTTTPNSPELNSIVEKMNGTLSTRTACMLHHAGAPQELFPYAFTYAAHIQNLAAQPNIQGDAPVERMSRGKDRRFDLSKIHVFGCNAYVLRDKARRGKLDSKTRPGVYLGYNEQYDAHEVLIRDDTLHLKVVVSRNVDFVETSFTNMAKFSHGICAVAEDLHHAHDKRSKSKDDAEDEYEVEYISADRLNKGVKEYKVHWMGYEDPTWVSQDNLVNCDEVLASYESSKHNHEHAHVATSATPDPKSYNEARRSKDKDKWEEAMEDELTSINDREVFTPCQLPKGRKAIPSRWVFKTKHNERHEITRFKARIVVKGYLQREGQDFFETYSPTVGMKSLKYMLALAAHNDWEIRQIDFDTAFLNATLKEDIYVQIPEGYRGQFPPGTVLKLNRALYGLKQAPREWWLELDAFLNTLGYQASQLDPCLYAKVVNGKRIYLAVYVDDTMAFFDKSLEATWLEDKAKIAAKYKIKDLGECEWILNMAVKRDREKRTITLSQQTYVEDLLKTFGMDQCKPTSTPFKYEDLTVLPDGCDPLVLDEEEHEEYRSIVGSLLYAANWTRPDLSYVVGVLARFVSKPYNYHLNAAKHVLRYLNGTKDKHLTFGTSTDVDRLVIYSDSNWAGDRADRKSTGGHISVFHGHPIVWQCKKQTTIALSSAEAEYYALGEAVREALFIRQWYKIYTGRPLAVEIKEDNQGAIYMSDHPTNHSRTKHIDIQHFFIREHVKNKDVNITYIPTADQLADILTKATSKATFLSLRGRLMN